MMDGISWYVDPNELTIRPIELIFDPGWSEDQVKFQWWTSKGLTGGNPAVVNKVNVFENVEDALKFVGKQINHMIHNTSNH